MSSDIGNAFGKGLALYPDDKRGGDERFFGNDELFQPDQLADLYIREDIDYGGTSFRTPWWPAFGGFVGDLAVDVALTQQAAWWGDPWINCGGCNGRWAFVGITRDANGQPLAGCTVRAFRTSTNELVAQVTSDANGYYIATTPYGDGHFLTVHLSGSPPVGGASVDTLTPG